MWLNLRTGYSFKSVFGHLEETLSKCKKYAGIADIGTTYGHLKWKEACEKVSIKPIYGARIKVSDLHPQGSKTKRYKHCEMSFIATSKKGLRELYNLIDLSHKQFYQFPKITYKQLNKTSNDLIVLSGISPELDKIKRKVYLQLSPNLPKALIDCGLEPVACVDNYYPDKLDKAAYESLTVHQFTMENKTTPMHILTDKEWLKLFPGKEAALTLRNELAKKAAGVEIPTAPMVKYDTKNSNEYLKHLCKLGAKNKRGMVLKSKYKARLKRELAIIKEKDFADYFLVVHDLIEHCKKKMPIGPGRGSAAGSLVCYLLGITEIDPLKYGLLFERFIDINRSDWPDIDFDLKDQSEAIKYLQTMYGSDCVAQMANINKLQPKSAIARVAKALNIPAWELEEFKESIEERPEGDERAREAIKDSFDSSKIGRDILDKFPNLYHVESLEGHPSHVGIHAAGIIVCPQPLNRYCGINSRTKKHVAMIDKRDAEKLNLLKIDALGLTTLSILGEVCDQLQISYEDIYKIKLNDKKAYKLINSGNLPGIFQMEGAALGELAKEMKTTCIEDLAALSALCRPGPLSSGAAHRYVKQKSGKESIKYVSKHPSFKDWTSETMGNIVYQEQIMGIVKEMGGLSWEDVTKVRKLMGKSQGDEAFNKYKEAFIVGAIENGVKKKEASLVWEEMKNFGKYGFNKCLAGSTKIKIANGNQYISGDITIAELYERYENNPTTSVKAQNRKPTLLSYDGKRGIPQKSVKIMKSGIKKCFRFTFDDGSIVECTKEHKFLIDGKWKAIKKAVVGSSFLSLEQEGYVLKGFKGNKGEYKNKQEGFEKGENNPSYLNGKTKAISEYRELMKNSFCEICNKGHERMEIHHKDFEGGNKLPYSLLWLCPSCHKKEHYKNGRKKKWAKGYKPISKRLLKVEKIGFVDTYDIEMPFYHNFMLSNGIVTHNSHAIAYSVLTYLTAYFKANHPLEFAVAILNNTSNNLTALKILRDLKERSNIKYEWFHEDAKAKWSVKDGVLLAGWETIEGIGPANAKTIEKLISNGGKISDLPPGIKKKLENPLSFFRYLYPGKQVYGDLYKKKSPYGKATHIKDIQEKGEYVFVGMLTKRSLKDLNDSKMITKRGGDYVKGPSSYVSMVLEDDTGFINVSIGRFQFEEIGHIVTDDTQLNKDWFVCYGKLTNKKYKRVYIENIRKITQIY